MGGQCPGNWRVHKPGDCKFKAIQQKKREATGNSPNQEGATLKHKKLKLNKVMKGLATHSDSEDSEKSRKVKSSKENSCIHKLFSLVTTLAYCLSTVEAEADLTVLGSSDSRDAEKWAQQSIKVHLNRGQLVEMTLLWDAIILAVELIGCVSMTKRTKTQNNAQKHNKND